MSFKKRILIDFDGVFHKYDSPWTTPGEIRDGPVDGAIEWLTKLAQDDRFEVFIYSARGNDEQGRFAMVNWLIKHGVPNTFFGPGMHIQILQGKPDFHVMIDDRAIGFDGSFGCAALDPNCLAEFKAWNKRKRQEAAEFKPIISREATLRTAAIFLRYPALLDVPLTREAIAEHVRHFSITVADLFDSVVKERVEQAGRTLG